MFEPEGLADSSRWSKWNVEHWIKINTEGHPGEVHESCTLSGCGEVFSPYRRSTLRCDLRLLSLNPLGG